jgi:predicted aspartyl protease
MSRMAMSRSAMTIVLILVLFGQPAFADAFQMYIEGDKLSLKAQRVPLQAVLRQLSAYGIAVRIDPQLNHPVTADFDNKDLEEGLKSLIRPLNSIYIWKPDPKPVGMAEDATDRPAYRLVEVQVFKPGEKERMVYLAEEPDASAPQLPQEDHREASLYETPVIIKADRVFVPVVLGYGGRKIEVTLIFDTGANSMVLHQNVAEALGITDPIQAKGYGVGGIEIDAKLARLQSVQVGPFEKQDLRTAIVAYSGPPDSMYDGLLGMNFLRGLKYEIDFDAQVIRWGESY